MKIGAARTAAFGFVAVVVYVGATALGGVITPHYSQIGDTISELTANHAPHRVLLGVLYGIYNVALAVFAVGVFQRLAHDKRSRIAVVLLLVNVAAGLLMVLWFPQDSTGTPATTTGAVHIALAGVESLSIVVACVLFWLAWRRLRARRSLALASLAAAVCLMIAGPAAAIATAQGSSIKGLLERVTIGTFLLWVAFVSLVLLTADRTGDQAARRHPTRAARSGTAASGREAT